MSEQKPGCKKKSGLNVFASSDRRKSWGGKNRNSFCSSIPDVILPRHSETTTATTGIPKAFESSYWTEDCEITEMGSLLGAGVLPFTVHPQTREIYFLLGKEHFAPGWRGSNNWSAFEGGVKQTDQDVYHTAAREYMEESLGVLHENCTQHDIQNVREALENKDYALRVTLCISAGDTKRSNRFHVTFVRYFEWKDGIIEKFHQERQRLMNISKNATAEYIMDPAEKNHAAMIEKTTSPFIGVAPDFLEKSEIKLWTSSEMSDIVLHQNSRYEMFRSCFVRTMGVVLQEFQRRLSFKTVMSRRRQKDERLNGYS